MCGAMGFPFFVPGVRGRAGRRTGLGAILLAGLLGLSGCATKTGPTGDPVRMSESEFDVAADLWRRQGDSREALKHALRAVELDEENADAAHLVALLYLDFCQNGQRDECRLGEAEKYAKLSIAKSEKNLAAENTLSVIYIHQKRYEDAIAVLKPITENILYGTPELAWGNLGWAYLEQKKYNEAVSALERAVAAQPLFCVGNYRLGVALHALGRIDAARDALDRALETAAPGCANLQDALLERAQVQLGLQEVESARADLDRCVSLQKNNLTGKTCGKILAGIH
jgi:type IV pilus assembly protein PilF